MVVRLLASVILCVLASIIFYRFGNTKRSGTLPKPPKWPEFPCDFITDTGILDRPEIPRTHFAVQNAKIMAMTHNTMSRGLNAIHTQALNVKPGTKEARDMLLYASVAYDFIHDHHCIEERVYFPRIEAATGKQGLMDENLEQHRILEIELGVLKRYATETQPEQYDGVKLRKIIENLAVCLMPHLHEEIPTILNLWNKMSSDDLKSSYWALHKEAEKTSDLLKAAPFVLGCQDNDFLLDGESFEFPQLPSRVIYPLVDNIISMRHAGAWRFNPSTMYGKLRATEFFSDRNQIEK